MDQSIGNNLIHDMGISKKIEPENE